VQRHSPSRARRTHADQIALDTMALVLAPRQQMDVYLVGTDLRGGATDHG
jgi:hypothetical protein